MKLHRIAYFPYHNNNGLITMKYFHSCFRSRFVTTIENSSQSKRLETDVNELQTFKSSGPSREENDPKVAEEFNLPLWRVDGGYFSKARTDRVVVPVSEQSDSLLFRLSNPSFQDSIQSKICYMYIPIQMEIN